MSLSPTPFLPPPPPPPFLSLTQGILEAYHYAVSHTELYGPTNFSSFLDNAIESAKGAVTQDSQNYTILLVITVRPVCIVCNACQAWSR